MVETPRDDWPGGDWPGDDRPGGDWPGDDRPGDDRGGEPPSGVQHLMKLAVGCDSLATLGSWQAERRRRHGHLFHRTRMMPQRRAALLAGGSIYWVIRGQVAVRQALLDLRPVVEEDGRKAAHFILDPGLVRTLPRAQRAFQGWRYLSPAEAPGDLADAGTLARESSVGDAMPADLLAELRSLGLL